jgi:50S ribosomal subunit-associated GTPase HflX
VTREVLREIEATDVPRVLVLNKIDKVDAATRERLAVEWPDAVPLSVKDPPTSKLRQRIVAFFERDMVEKTTPYAKQRGGRRHTAAAWSKRATTSTARAARARGPRLRDYAPLSGTRAR